MKRQDEQFDLSDRARRITARARRRQLETALSGRIGDSARYAERAHRVTLWFKSRSDHEHAGSACVGM